MIKSVLLDLDGTLIDACEWHYQALNRALKEICNFEIARQEHEVIFNALSTKQKLLYLEKQNRVFQQDFQKIENLKQKYTKELIEQFLEPSKDKIELLKYIKSEGIKIACVTNSIAETTMLMLDKSGQLSFMDLIIHNQKVRYTKPHPEPYIKAMVYLNSLPEQTLIVEDSEKGMEAAKMSGAMVWKVKNSLEVNFQNFLKIRMPILDNKKFQTIYLDDFGNSYLIG